MADNAKSGNAPAEPVVPELRRLIDHRDGRHTPPWERLEGKP
jgi:hypothetical protein